MSTHTMNGSDGGAVAFPVAVAVAVAVPVSGTLSRDHNRSMPELHRFNYNKRVSKLPDANICTLCSLQQAK